MPSRNSIAFLCFRIVAFGTTVSAGEPPAASGVVGDANGDGVFSGLDVTFAKTVLRHGSNQLNPLADVARPCDGKLEPEDGKRLLAASLVAKDGIPVRSRCHREAIGEAIQPSPETPPLVTIDGLFLEVAARVPEFGGLFVEAGEPRVVLTDPSLLGAAWVEIERVFGRGRFDASRVSVVPARYTFSELASYKEEAEAFLGQGAVTFVDADERRNVLRLGLRDLRDRGNVERELARKGVPLAAVAFEARQPLTPNLDPLTTALQQKQRPLIGGLLIEIDDFGCTLGFLCRWGGIRGFVTNSHCLLPMGQETLKEVFQGGHDLEDRVGVERVDPPFGCGGTCRLSDAVFVALDRDATGRLGRLAGSPGAPSPAAIFWHYDITGDGIAVCGEEVHRVSYSSGEVLAEVTDTCSSAIVEDNFDPDGPDEYIVNCQTIYNAPSQAGDSGGPVFRRTGLTNQAELLGVHIGSGDNGVAAFSPVANIETQIGPLEVAITDELPEIEITAPPDGGSTGPGAFPAVDFEAEVFDFEAGGDCATCEVSWYSAKDGGPLGVTPWDDGESSLSTVLGGGPGWRAITATATDAADQTAWDTIVLSSGNGPPSVWIDWPPPATLYRNVPYQLRGSSFDSETFQALACADLTWTLLAGPPTVAFPAQGCFPVVTFESTGLYLLKLDGVDAGHLHGSAFVNVEVVNAPASAPPVITFTTPAPGTAIPFTTPTTVTATVTNPASGGLLTYYWYLTPGAGPAVFLGSGWVASGAQLSISLQASDFVGGGCGSTGLKLFLYATTPSVITGNGMLLLETIQPPC